MNELRMYVEHLFEGKVLTADNIELKEEIYGNLVARFEDYVAQGLSEEEALARTKESITSVDDVLSGATDAPDEDGAQPQAEEPAADLTEQLPAMPSTPATDATQAVPAVAAVAPVAAAGPAEQAPVQATARKKWPIVVGAAAAVLVLCGAVALGSLGAVGVIHGVAVRGEGRGALVELGERAVDHLVHLLVADVGEVDHVGVLDFGQNGPLSSLGTLRHD